MAEVNLSTKFERNKNKTKSVKLFRRQKSFKNH